MFSSGRLSVVLKTLTLQKRYIKKQNATTTRDWNNWYLLNYLTLLRILPTRANKATERALTGHQQKLTRLLRNKEQRRSKPDDNWVRNISSLPLDQTETRALSYGLKHSATPKRIPTEAIVSRVEAALSQQRELSSPTKDNIRSRIASTIQSASRHGNNFTKDEQHALKWL